MTKHNPHLFLKAQELNEKKITSENFHHLFRVLRLNTGSVFFALDNSGNRFECRVTEIGKKEAGFMVGEKEFRPKSDLSLKVFCSLLKLDKFEEILDKATQMGVTDINPFISDFSTVSADLYRKKYERFRQILKCSAEQSQRFFLPELGELISFAELLKKNSAETTIVAYEKAEQQLKKTLRNFSFTGEVNLIFGPEGGFSETEIGLLREKKVSEFSLGKNILRAETAVLSTISMVKYHFDLV